MPLRGREIVGRAVIDQERGEELGRVQDLFYDPRRRAVGGLALNTGGVLPSKKILSFSAIASSGPDAFALDGAREIARGRDADLVSWQELRGARVIGAGGAEVGSLADLVVEAPSGHLQALEVSGGLVSDIIDGYRLIAADRVLTWGTDTIVVQEEA